MTTPDPPDSNPPDRPSRREDLVSAYDEIVSSFGTGPAPTRSGEAESRAAPAGKDALLQAFDKVVEHEAGRPLRDAAGPPVKRSALRRFLPPVVAVVCATATLLIWLLRPAWVFPDLAPPERLATDIEARKQVAEAAFLVEEFYEREGRMPGSPAEAGIDVPGIVMRGLGGDRYEVRATGPGQTFVLEGQAGAAP